MSLSEIAMLNDYVCLSFNRISIDNVENYYTFEDGVFLAVPLGRAQLLSWQGRQKCTI